VNRFQSTQAMLIRAKGEPTLLRLEPWGEELTLKGGIGYTVQVKAEIEGVLEIEVSTDAVTLFAWPTSAVRVLAGNDTVCDCSIPCPPTPPERKWLTRRGSRKRTSDSTLRIRP